MDVELLSRRVRFLTFWAILSTVLAVAALSLVALSQFHRSDFDGITARKITIADANGTARLIIANTENFPAPVDNGRVLRARSVANAPALIFYNASGDEQGGLRWNGQIDEKGHYSQFAALSFDQFRQNDALILYQGDDDHQHSAGLAGVERTDDRPLDALIDDLRAAEGAAHGDAQRAAVRARFIARHFGAKRRFFSGFGPTGSVVELGDAGGHPRLRMTVKPGGAAAIEFLDPAGRVTSSVGPSGFVAAHRQGG